METKEKWKKHAQVDHAAVARFFIVRGYASNLYLLVSVASLLWLLFVCLGLCMYVCMRYYYKTSYASESSCQYAKRKIECYF